MDVPSRRVRGFPRELETGMLSRRGDWYLILGYAIHYYSEMADQTLAYLSRVPLRLCMCL